MQARNFDAKLQDIFEQVPARPGERVRQVEAINVMRCWPLGFEVIFPILKPIVQNI